MTQVRLFVSVFVRVKKIDKAGWCTGYDLFGTRMSSKIDFFTSFPKLQRKKEWQEKNKK